MSELGKEVELIKGARLFELKEQCMCSGSRPQGPWFGASGRKTCEGPGRGRGQGEGPGGVRDRKQRVSVGGSRGKFELYHHTRGNSQKIFKPGSDMIGFQFWGKKKKSVDGLFIEL